MKYQGTTFFIRVIALSVSKDTIEKNTQENSLKKCSLMFEMKQSTSNTEGI